MIYYDILWYIMIYYDILWYIMIYYDRLWYIMIHYDTYLLHYDILWYIMIYYDILWYIMIVYYCDDYNLILIVIMVMILRTWRSIHRTEAFGGWSPEVFLRKSWRRPWGHVVATVIAERKKLPAMIRKNVESCWVQYNHHLAPTLNIS